VPFAARFVAAIVLLPFLCVSVAGQQPLTQEQIHHVNKVMKSLAHYDTGTKLDVLLNNDTHLVGMLSQTGSTSFVLIDPANSKSETIDFLDVKRVRLTRKEYAAQQVQKTVNALPIALACAGVFVAVLAILAIKNGDR